MSKHVVSFLLAAHLQNGKRRLMPLIASPDKLTNAFSNFLQHFYFSLWVPGQIPKAKWARKTTICSHIFVQNCKTSEKKLQVKNLLTGNHSPSHPELWTLKFAFGEQYPRRKICPKLQATRAKPPTVKPIFMQMENYFKPPKIHHFWRILAFLKKPTIEPFRERSLTLKIVAFSGFFLR